MRLLALFLLTLCPAAADPVEISLYCFRQVPGLGTIRVPTSGGAATEIRLSTANIVDPLKAETQDGTLTFLGMPESPDKPPKPAGRVTLPGGPALVILVPAAKGAAMPYHCFTVARTDDGFPLGSYQVVNLSPFHVRGAIGRSPVEVKPAGVTRFKPEGTPGTNLGARFEFHEDGAWKLLTETRCAIRADRRWLLFAYKDPQSGRMNLRSIPDRAGQLPAASPEAP